MKTLEYAMAAFCLLVLGGSGVYFTVQLMGKATEVMEIAAR